jgi:hypothetical protein
MTSRRHDVTMLWRHQSFTTFRPAGRVDAAARRQGISRTAWLHVAASKALE